MRLEMKKVGLIVFIVIFITQFGLVLNSFNSIFYSNYLQYTQLEDLNQTIYPKNSLDVGSNLFMSNGIGQDVSLYCIINETFVNNDTQQDGIEIINKVSNWNMTEFKLNFTDIAVEDIEVQFESRNDGSEPYSEINRFYAVSFTIPNTCYIKNASMFIQYWGSGSGFDESVFSIGIYNATTILSDLYPHKALHNSSDETLFVLTGQPVNQPARWYQANFTNRKLDITNTINNTFFIVFQSVEYPTLVGFRSDTFFYYAEEQPEDEYDIKLYKKEGSIPWEELKGKSGLFRVGFAPISYNPNPEQVNLTVFDSQVDISGQYINLGFIEPQNNKFLIPISSSWLGTVQYNVTFEGKFNYLTKTSTEFKSEINKDVIWNSTVVIDKFPINSYNQTANIYNPQHWIYNKTFKASQEFDNITNFGSYIEIDNCSNALWNIRYTQINSILNVSIQSSSDMDHWIDVLVNVNSTDYINATANLLNSNGKVLLYVTTSSLDLAIEQDIANLTHQFPLWRPDLNTSIMEDGELIQIKIMTYNGTMAGIYLQTFNVNLMREDANLEFFREISNRYVWGTSMIIDTKLTSQGIPIEGAFIQFYIFERYSNGIVIETILNDTTDDDGIAGVVFVINELDSIEVGVKFDGDVHYSEAILTRYNIDIVSPIEQFFLDYIILILGSIVILAGSVSYSIIKGARRKKI